MKYFSKTQIAKTAGISTENARRVILLAKAAKKAGKEMTFGREGSCYEQRGKMWYDNGRSPADGGAVIQLTY